MNKYKIDKDIPIPERTSTWTDFPLDKMKIGDSFFVKKSDYKKTSLIQLKSFLWHRIQKYLIENCNTSKFAFQKDRVNQGIRVFKIQ